MPPTDAILALDLGTGELKAGLVSLDGHVLAAARATYRIDPDARRAEQDPDAWWGAAVEAVGALRDAAPHVDVAAVCADAQGPTCVAVDASGQPTRPAITWLDRRSVAERDELALATGHPGWLLGILPTALWIERHEPGVASRTAHYLAAWEWLAMRLGGVAAQSLSAGQLVPDATVVASLGLPRGRIPAGVAAGSVLGGLTPMAAVDLGLPAGTPIVAGLNDAYASCLGAGLLEAGDALDTGGSSGGFAVYASAEPHVPGAWIAPAPLPGRWLVGGAMAATGRALDWLRDDVLGGTWSTSELLDAAAAVEPGADGLVFLPYLAGERSPIWDADARGAFVGLTLVHGRGHLARAVLEAAAFAIRHVAEPIATAGHQATELRVCGANARGDTWNRIKADVLGVPVAVPEETDTAMLGSAILGATGIGAATDLPTAIGGMVRFSARLEPDPGTGAVYDERYAVYTSLYPVLRDAMHALNRPAEPRP